MTSTTDRLAETRGPDQKNRGGRRWSVVALVIGVLVLIVAGVVWVGATREDDPSASPAEVQQAADDFAAASEAGVGGALHLEIRGVLRVVAFGGRAADE
jgi:hypothetical protein